MLTLCGSSARASDWGCQVLLCLSNPSGPTAVKECEPPIHRLWRALHKRHPDPFPSCDEARASGAYAEPTQNYYDPCPAGTTALPAGERAMRTSEASGVSVGWVVSTTSRAYVGIGDGQGLMPSAETPLQPKICVGPQRGTQLLQSDYSDTEPMLVATYDRIVVLDPATTPNVINVYIGRELARSVRYGPGVTDSGADTEVAALQPQDDAVATGETNFIHPLGEPQVRVARGQDAVLRLRFDARIRLPDVAKPYVHLVERRSNRVIEPMVENHYGQLNSQQWNGLGKVEYLYKVNVPLNHPLGTFRVAVGIYRGVTPYDLPPFMGRLAGAGVSRIATNQYATGYAVGEITVTEAVGPASTEITRAQSMYAVPWIYWE